MKGLSNRKWKTTEMLFWTILFSFAAVVQSVPFASSKRQLSGILAGLQGIFGQNASFGMSCLQKIYAH